MEQMSVLFHSSLLIQLGGLFPCLFAANQLTSNLVRMSRRSHTTCNLAGLDLASLRCFFKHGYLGSPAADPHFLVSKQKHLQGEVKQREITRRCGGDAVLPF